MDDAKKKVQPVADDFKAPGDPTKHDMSVDRKNEHISKKVYMFPESYNALRRELEENWPTLWLVVGRPMWQDAPKFIQLMDETLDEVTQFDSGNVDGICKKYLDRLRAKRGLLPLHNPSEYFHNEQMEKSIREARDQHENTSPWKQ